MSSSMAWKLVAGLFRGLALFSARSWPEGKPSSGWDWNGIGLVQLCLCRVLTPLSFSCYMYCVPYSVESEVTHDVVVAENLPNRRSKDSSVLQRRSDSNPSVGFVKHHVSVAFHSNNKIAYSLQNGQ